MNFTVRTQVKQDVQIIHLTGFLDNVLSDFLFEVLFRATAVSTTKPNRSYHNSLSLKMLSNTTICTFNFLH